VEEIDEELSVEDGNAECTKAVALMSLYTETRSMGQMGPEPAAPAGDHSHNFFVWHPPFSSRTVLSLTCVVCPARH